eukprot:gene11842-13072_t
MEAASSDVLWIVIVGFIFAFILAFGIGANDVANSFGTSVGAKVLTLRQACFIAAIFELAGAVLIGSKVSDTVRKGIIDINLFAGSEKNAMIGALSALCGTSIWLIVATFFKLPVSGSHSVVGATIGYALVAYGASGIKWKKFGMIAASWVISPLLSGAISSLIFILIRKFILRRTNPFKYGLRSLPFFYGFTIAINLFSIFFDSSASLGIDHLEWYIVVCISIGSGLAVFLLVHFLVAPWLKKRIDKASAAECSSENIEASSSDDPITFAATEERSPVRIEMNGTCPVVSVRMPDRSFTDAMPPSDGVARLKIPSSNETALRAIPPDEMTISSTLSSDYPTLEGVFPSEEADRLTIPKPNEVARRAVTPDEITLTSTLSSTSLPDMNDTLEANVVSSNAAGTNEATGEGPTTMKLPRPHEVALRAIAPDQVTLTSTLSSGSLEINDILTSDNVGNADKETGNSFGAGSSDATLRVPMPHEVAFRAISPSGYGVDATFPHQISVPTTPVVGRRTDELQLFDESPAETVVAMPELDAPRSERSDSVEMRKVEKEQERLLARNRIADDPKVAKLFEFLQILTASFGSFAHGGNDVSNAIGPVISIWIIYRTGLVVGKASTPIWILLYGGVGIVIGLFLWGRRVIETIGENLTPVTPTSGFSIEIGSALTVLIASNLGIPVSTTHCKVGSVVFTGRVRSRDVVDWSLFGNIVISWIVTMPITDVTSSPSNLSLLLLLQNQTVASVAIGMHYPNRLFVGALPGSASATDLAEFFKKFGTVLEGKVVLDNNGNSRRFGFVTFTTNEDVQRVLSHGPVFFKGKQIKIGPAVKRSISEDGPSSPAPVQENNMHSHYQSALGRISATKQIYGFQQMSETIALPCSPSTPLSPPLTPPAVFLRSMLPMSPTTQQQFFVPCLSASQPNSAHQLSCVNVPDVRTSVFVQYPHRSPMQCTTPPQIFAGRTVICSATSMHQNQHHHNHYQATYSSTSCSSKRDLTNRPAPLKLQQPNQA